MSATTSSTLLFPAALISTRVLKTLAPFMKPLIRILSTSTAKFTVLLLLLSRRVNSNSKVKGALSVIFGMLLVGYALAKYHHR